MGRALRKIGTRSGRVSASRPVQGLRAHPRLDAGGVNGVDPNVLRRKLIGQCPAQPDDAVFGRRVRDVQRRALQPGRRADVDQAAAALDEMRYRGGAGVPRYR